MAIRIPLPDTPCGSRAGSPFPPAPLELYQGDLEWSAQPLPAPLEQGDHHQLYYSQPPHALQPPIGYCQPPTLGNIPGPSHADPMASAAAAPHSSEGKRHREFSTLAPAGKNRAVARYYSPGEVASFLEDRVLSFPPQDMQIVYSGILWELHMDAGMRAEAAKQEEALGEFIRAEIEYVQTPEDALGLLQSILARVRDFYGHIKASLRSYFAILREQGMYRHGRKHGIASYGGMKRANELFIRGYVVALEREIRAWEPRSHIPISAMKGAWDMARRIFNLHERSLIARQRA